MCTRCSWLQCPGTRNVCLPKPPLVSSIRPHADLLTCRVAAPSSLNAALYGSFYIRKDAQQEIHLANTTSCCERWLLRIAYAGSLLVVLLLRTAHFNLAKLRDVYLHTNTLAALANLAPHAQDLSSHAAQRLVSLFDVLARRWDTCPPACSHKPVSLLAPSSFCSLL